MQDDFSVVDPYIVKLDNYQEIANRLINKIVRNKEDSESTNSTTTTTTTGSTSSSTSATSTAEDIDSIDESSESLGWQNLSQPIQSLNIVYPNQKLTQIVNEEITEEEGLTGLQSETLVGTKGLKNVMKFNKKERKDYEYVDGVERVFDYENIGKYSAKIKHIIDSVINSEGVIILFSEYIDSGCIPLALALESVGLKRYRSQKTSSPETLMKRTQLSGIQPRDALTMKPRDEFVSSQIEGEPKFKQARYAIITGDKNISPNPAVEIKAATSKSNVYGSDIKVIIISRTGSEGVDFKYIRQVHILEPWFNLSRPEQVIGRAVRVCSHTKLPFNKRNVEVFMYGSVDGSGNKMIDLDVYKHAQKKAIKIGQVSRILKQNAVDCLLNENMNTLTSSKLVFDETNMLLSSGKMIENYQIGDKPNSGICDFMEQCEYKCIPDVKIDDLEVNIDTYDKSFIDYHVSHVGKTIRQLFKDKYVMKKEDIIRNVNYKRNYSIEIIDQALDNLVNNKDQRLVDMLGRPGYLVNVEDIYLYQPNEFAMDKDNNKSLLDRRVPVTFKPRIIPLNVKGLELVNEFETDDEDESDGDIIEDTKQPEVEDVEQVDEDVVVNQSKLKSILRETVQEIIKTIERIFTETPNRSHIESSFARLKGLITSDELNNDDELNERQIIKKLLVAFVFDRLSMQDKLNITYELYNLLSFDDIDVETINMMREHIKQHYIISVPLYDGASETEYMDVFVVSDSKEKDLKGSLKYIGIDKVNNTFIDLSINNDSIRARSKEAFKANSFIDDHSNKIHDVIGFIRYFKSTKKHAFKNKYIMIKSNRGSMCYQSRKENIAKMRNSLIDLLDENDLLKELHTDASLQKIQKFQLCHELELLMRLFDNKKIAGKRFFFTEEQAIINNLA